MKLKDVKEKLEVDSCSKRNGIFTVREGFFYTHGRTEKDLEKAVLNAFPTAIIIDSGMVWKPFKGGASTADQSHWWVKFSVKRENEEKKGE